MLGKQANDERLYLKRKDGGRGIKSLRDTYRETRVRVACYMACSENRWISAAWRREKYKEENSIVEEATKTMENIGKGIQFEEGGIQIDGEQIDGGWKPAGRRMKKKLKGGRKTNGSRNTALKNNKVGFTKSKRRNVIYGWHRI